LVFYKEINNVNNYSRLNKDTLVEKTELTFKGICSMANAEEAIGCDREEDVALHHYHCVVE